MGEHVVSGIVILEGPDGGGKTELANYVSERRRGGRTHHGPYAGQSAISEHYMRDLEYAVAHPDETLVMDRCWVSEPVYASAVRVEAPRVSVEERRALERVALTARAVVVFCLPPLSTCLTNFAKEGRLEYPESASQLAAVHGLYEQEVLRWQHNGRGLPCVVYDYTTQLPSKALELVTGALPRRNRGPGEGHWNPGRVTLVVGPEPRGDRADAMARRFEAIGVQERELYWVQPHGSNGNRTSARFVKQLRPRITLAVGGGACEWCDEANVSHVELPDPLHWEEYGEGPYPMDGRVEG